MNQICDRFEDAWNLAPPQPVVAEFLTGIPEISRPELLRQLLTIDIEFRRKQDGVADSKQIGPYKLLQQIGEGGMGTVWMAEQQHPFRRRIALKVIKAGMGNKQVIARFEVERQAVAMMNHENTARILDAGATDNGQPYFVMELVQGIPFNKYCDQNKLSIKDRLELFAPVCKAVQHAHQKGIVHRDLKPSNVLVCLYDGVPVPKVIGFGLAKALQQQTRLTDKTMFTEFGRVVGTLQYMSPEQAEMNQLDIDTRTDIYSLGVVLYELLTGSTPIDQEKLKSQAILKILETIREKEPPRPSIRLGSSTSESVSGISAQRQIDPNKLKNILRGELDWIVMKSIEKDRTRRYETATRFADDIVNFLNGEVVEARPPTPGYRVTRFCAKYQKVLAVVSLLTIVLGLSTIFVYFSAIRERALRITPDNALAEMKAQAKRTKHSESIAMAAIDRLSLIEQLEGTYFKAAQKWTSSFNSSAGPAFPVDHIIARQHDGETFLDNLALSCVRYNSYKEPNIAGLDPKSGALTRLFHPRQDRWADHFEFPQDEIVGLTDIGMTTARLLQLHHPDSVALRQPLIEEGFWL